MRWVYGILLLVSAIIGIYQNQSNVPNQQIVLQFDEKNQNIDEAVSRITDQLQDVGASKINIQTTSNSSAIITYFSSVDVFDIEMALQTDSESSSQKSQSQSEPETLYFDIFEIKAQQNTSWDFEGTLVAYGKEHLDRPVLSDSFSDYLKSNDRLEFTGLFSNDRTRNYQVALLHNTSYEIPEVRAGPNC